MKNPLRRIFQIGIPITLTIVFLVWSYTQIDPNLILSTNSIYLHFQDFLRLVANNRILSTCLYTFLIVAFFYFYTRCLRPNTRSLRQIYIPLIIVPFLVLLSYPALSHDIFNYIFDARMVVKYHVNPQFHTALEFSHDDWTRFMHNVHTPSPYGFAWTVLSTIPYFIGMGKFTVTLFSFKAFMALGFVLLVIIQRKLLKLLTVEQPTRALLFFIANPLVLIETLSSGHNDIWMMAGVFLSLYILFRAIQYKKCSMLSLSSSFLTSFIVFAISIQMKFVPAVLSPIWLFLVGVAAKVNIFKRGTLEKFVLLYWADICALLLFLPLFTSRSQQFNPWYLIWSLSFLPFIKIRKLRIILIIFSLTSLLRYIPFLLTGQYTPSSQLVSFCITWSASLSLLLFFVPMKRFLRRTM